MADIPVHEFQQAEVRSFSDKPMHRAPVRQVEPVVEVQPTISLESLKGVEAVGAIGAGTVLILREKIPDALLPLTFLFDRKRANRLPAWEIALFTILPVFLAIGYYMVAPGQLEVYPLNRMSSFLHLLLLIVKGALLMSAFRFVWATFCGLLADYRRKSIETWLRSTK